MAPQEMVTESKTSPRQLFEAAEENYREDAAVDRSTRGLRIRKNITFNGFSSV